MTTIQKEILKNQKEMTLAEYKEWLKNKLDEYRIDRNRLIATIIVVERSLCSEQQKLHTTRVGPYYKLFKDDGKTTTRAWINAAELVLWLRYNHFKAHPYVQSVVEFPFVRRMLRKPTRKQLPLNILFPAARKNSDRIREYIKHHRIWASKH